MNIKLETLYAIHRSLSDIRDKYEIASIKNDSSYDLDWLCKKFKELEDSINQEGKVFAYVFRAYFISINDDNEYINFRENLDNKSVSELVDCLRENGIEYFTFSSGWSSALDSIWNFTQNGCTIVETTEVVHLGDKEKALLFKVEKASQQTDELRQRIMKFTEEYDQWDYDAAEYEKETIEEMVYGLRAIKDEMDKNPAIEMDDDLKAELEELIRLTADVDVKGD